MPVPLEQQPSLGHAVGADALHPDSRLTQTEDTVPDHKDDDQASKSKHDPPYLHRSPR